MRLCVTSRPEADIERVLRPLAFRSVSLHGENGQVEDIAEYVKFVVSTDRNMKKWRKEDKELVITVLKEKAGGMCWLNTIVRHSFLLTPCKNVTLCFLPCSV